MWVLGLGGAQSLVLIPHVALLFILGFWKVPVHILYGEQCPGKVVIVPDALDTNCFGGKPPGCMEVSDCAR